MGFGTKMGNGCTSGHGVCGLPRLAPRSIVAVSCFMGMGLLTASIKENFSNNIKLNSSSFGASRSNRL